MNTTIKDYKTDCRLFMSDRPCKPHKTTGVTCPECKSYDPVKMRIAIVKLDALGDVLRTTSILKGLKNKYPQSQIYWFTLKSALPLLENIELIDKAIAVNDAANAFWVENMLSVEKFDLAINLDAAYKSASIAARMKADEKLGYILNENGTVSPCTPEAEHWFLMGINDAVKKANTRTYQSMMAQITGISDTDMEIIVNLSEQETGYADNLAVKLGLSPAVPTIGICPGSGARWPKKRWLTNRYAELIDRLNNKYKVNILLLGGPEETPIIEDVMKYATTRVFNTSTNHSMRNFMAIVNLCDVILTADTICMHIASGLQKNSVILFGPTSAAEIETYGRGTKIVPDIECFCCYKGECDVSPSCMEKIQIGTVEQAMDAYIKPLIETSANV